MTKIESFRDLIAWQVGVKLVISVYKITKLFPREELFILTTQMRRCAISITSNIAEGFSRRNKKEKNQFYYIALGSLTELQNQVFIAKGLGYLSEKVFTELDEQMIRLHKLLNGLIKSSSTYT